MRQPRIERDAVLDVPMPQAGPVVVDRLEADCLVELERRRATTGMAGLVRERLSAAADRVPSLPEIAADLHVAERTLRRRLEAEGTSFRELDAVARADRARRMLATTDLPIDVIAGRLGYSLASAFTHAFRRWTGQTPSGYRVAAGQGGLPRARGGRRGR